MKKILFINSVCGVGSTGRICTDLYDLASESGYDCCIAYGRDSSFAPRYKTIRIGSKLDMYVHGIISRLFDAHGFASKGQTKKFLNEVKKYNPDIIHLHNIHGYYLNVDVLFDFLKKNQNIKVVWTFHDCWPFTGHCAYFTYNNCMKWKDGGCQNCQYKETYPASAFLSRASANFLKKKKAFLGLNNLTIVTPSAWLADLVKESFLKNYPVKVINNGIELKNFYKDKTREDSKTHILAIANIWEQRKGLDEVLKLDKTLDYSKFGLTVIGVSDEQASLFSKNVNTVRKTKNIDELREYYSQADVLFNPTKEDNYPTVNLEAQACGTPVYTYDIGGSKETLKASSSKIIENFDSFVDLLKTTDFKDIKQSFTVDLSLVDKNVKMKEYIDLYNEILKDGQ